MKNGISYEKNGWLYISVKGTPKERGYAYGYYCASKFKEIQRMMNYIAFEDTGKKWEFFIEAAQNVLYPTIKTNFPEFLEEMEGITEGCIAGGTPTTLYEIIAWNNYITLMDSWYPNSEEGSGASGSREGGAGSNDRCSAFIANGDYTTDGRIVIAHNSFCNFVDGQYYDVILDIEPIEGYRILMQTSACSIWSGTDVFVTSGGFIGTETTIGGFLPYENNYPISCRIRKAMQYASSLDDYSAILLEGNSGDYANSWLIGDIKTNEIMVIELGLKYHDIKKTTNGYFYGCNVAFNPEIRNLECANSGYCDIRRHQGARQVRIPDLMEQHKGKINVEIAKQIIGDHFDVYLARENPCSRTVCSHYDLDDRAFMSDQSRPKPFSPRGAIDGAVITSESGEKMGFYMRYGNSCGIPFVVEDFCDKHRQWAHLGPYLRDRPQQPWTYFSIFKKMHKKSLKKKKVRFNTSIRNKNIPVETSI